MAAPQKITVPIELEIDGVGLDERLTRIEAQLLQLTRNVAELLAKSYRTPETGPR